MPLGNLGGSFSPDARVTTALIPVLAALVLRLLFGKDRLTRVALSVATVWFAINIMMAPNSVEMRQEILNLGTRLR